MITKTEIERLLPRPNGARRLIVNDQDTDDIVDLILNEIDNKSNYKKISSYFDRGNGVETARDVFDFLKDNFVYRIESNERQTVKSLSRFFLDGFGDCKHFSTFIGGVLNALNYPFFVRFVSYTDNPEPTHVFIVLKDDQQRDKEVWVDAVNSFFNSRTPRPIWQKDYIFGKKTMALNYLSGIGAEYNTGIRNDLDTMTAMQEAGEGGGFFSVLGDIGSALLGAFGSGGIQAQDCPTCQTSYKMSPSMTSVIISAAAGFGIGYLIKKL